MLFRSLVQNLDVQNQCPEPEIKQKAAADPYCHEDGTDKEDEGHSHQVQCTNDGCEIWTDVWIPNKVLRNSLKRPFYYGCCSADKFAAIEIAMREEAKSTRETYAEITKNQDLARSEAKKVETEVKKGTGKIEELRSLVGEKSNGKTNAKVANPSAAVLLKTIRTEEKQQSARETNLVISNPPQRQSAETSAELVSRILTDLGTNIQPQTVEEKVISKKPNEGERRLLKIKLRDVQEKWKKC